MPATTVETATDVDREPDAATATSKSAVTLNYEAMFAALNDLLAEIREERREAEASGKGMSSMARKSRPPNPTYGSKRTPSSPGYSDDLFPRTWLEMTWRAGSVAAVD